MRGRTNISGGITLNANTDDFVVATGNSITGGDFVEYEYNNTSAIALGAGAYQNCYTADSATNLYVSLINDIVTLFVRDHGVIDVLASYNSKTYTSIFQYNDTTYITNDGDVFTIDKTNHTVTLARTISVRGAVFGIGNGYVCDTHSYTTTGGSDIYLNTYDINGTHKQEKKLYTSSTSLNMNTHFFTYSGGIGYVQSSHYSRSSQYYCNGNIFIIPIGSDGSIGNTAGTSLFSVQASSSTTGTISLLNNVCNRYIPVSYYYTQTGTTYNFTKLYDTVSNTLISVSTTRYAEATNVNSSGLFLVGYGTNGIVLFKLNLQNNVVTQLDTDTTNTGLLWVFKDLEYGAINITNNTLTNIIIDNGNLIQVGTPSDRVKQWSGTGNPMGVAKGTGTSGETIEVYIPQVSS